MYEILLSFFNIQLYQHFGLVSFTIKTSGKKLHIILKGEKPRLKITKRLKAKHRYWYTRKIKTLAAVITVGLIFPILSFLHCDSQQREPFLHLSEPAPVVSELTSDDGLALRLDALE